MVSTSSADIARALLAQCLSQEKWDEALLAEIISRAASADHAVSTEASLAFFGILIERLGDLFEPRLCDVYARLFAQVIETLLPDLRAKDLFDRYSRVRQVRACRFEPRTVYVLSRITLGADVAVTSVLLAAARKRFPHARLVFVGPRKNFKLFEASNDLELFEYSYRRGGDLRERLASRPMLDASDAIVLDPDSRLTQLGLLSVCPEDRYFFFESRALRAETDWPLPRIASEWCEQVLGTGAEPFAAPAPVDSDTDVAISLGVGENPEKRVDDEFERGLLAGLSAQGRRVVVDRGTGRDEPARVDRASAGLPAVELYTGDYAPFAARIARARLYIGYDSAGQHVASATGTPLISVFKGFVSQRMLHRWTPCGHDRIAVLPISNGESPLGRVLDLAAQWR